MKRGAVFVCEFCVKICCCFLGKIIIMSSMQKKKMICADASPLPSGFLCEKKHRVVPNAIAKPIKPIT